MIKTCVVCGGEFEARAHNSRTCSPICAIHWRRTRDAARHKAAYTPQAVVKKCVICEKSFIPRNAARTCSPECKAERKRATKRAEKARYYARHPERRKEQRDRYYAKPEKRELRAASAKEWRKRKQSEREQYLAKHPEIDAEIDAREAEIKTFMTPKIKHCVECGDPFHAKANVKTCSDACWLVRHRRLRRRPEKHLVPAALMQKKRDAQNRLNARRNAALKFIRELEAKNAIIVEMPS